VREQIVWELTVSYMRYYEMAKSPNKMDMFCVLSNAPDEDLVYRDVSPMLG
jgi:hypothetical protein